MFCINGLLFEYSNILTVLVFALVLALIIFGLSYSVAKQTGDPENFRTSVVLSLSTMLECI